MNTNNPRQERIDKILFDTVYRRRIGFKDWLYTKHGIFSIALLIFLVVTERTDGSYLFAYVIFVMYFFMKESTLLFEKSKLVYGYVKLEEMHNKLKKARDESIISAKDRNEGKMLIEYFSHPELYDDEKKKPIKKVKQSQQKNKSKQSGNKNMQLKKATKAPTKKAKA